MEKILLIEKISMPHNAKYYAVKSLKRKKVKSSEGCEKKKLTRRKYSVDTLADTATVRSSHWGCSVRKGVLRNFAKFTGKHLCLSLFFNKVAGCRTEPCNFI